MGEGKKHLEKVVEDMHTTRAAQKANPIDALDPPLESIYEIEHDLFLWEENFPQIEEGVKNTLTLESVWDFKNHMGWVVK